jgi:hypothetical protein
MQCAPTRKYERSNCSVVASEEIDRLITETDMTNTHIAEFMNDSISYNRVRDIRKMLTAPVCLTEFLNICNVCKADPVQVLEEINRGSLPTWKGRGHVW